MSWSPRAPASTTPAARFVGFSSRVRLTVPCASVAMRRNISTTSGASAAADFSNDAVRLRIVPGAGALTASYAYLRANSAARRTSATPAVSLPANASFRPRMTCERITPLFPRAPISAP